MFLHSRLIPCALAFLGIVSCKSRLMNEGSDVKIFGGCPVTEGAVLKSVVALRFDDKIFCTGTVIAPNIVITAGHCIPETMPMTDFTSYSGRDAKVKTMRSKMNVAFGACSSTPVATRKVVEVSSHPDFASFIGLLNDAVINPTQSAADRLKNYSQNRVGWHDIALLKFEGTLPEGFAAAQTSTSMPKNGTAISMAGYGVSEVGAGDQGNLQMAQSKVNSIEDNRDEFTTDNQTHGTCKGDSGGPVFILAANVVTVYGITSRGTDPETCHTKKSIYTDVGSHNDWLVKTKAALEKGGIVNPGSGGTTTGTCSAMTSGQCFQAYNKGCSWNKAEQKCVERTTTPASNGGTATGNTPSGAPRTAGAFDEICMKLDTPSTCKWIDSLCKWQNGKCLGIK